MQLGAFDDLHGDVGDRPHPGSQGASVVSGVSPDQREPGAGVQQRNDQQLGAHPVTHTGSGDHHGEQEPFHIHRDVSLPAVDLLASIKPAGGGPDGVRAFHRLGVHDRRAGLPVTAQRLPQPAA